MKQATRTARLAARITPEGLAVVRQAAALQGRSLSDFVVAAVQEVAYKAIEDAHIIRLAVADQHRFAELLLDPPALSPAMERAREAHDHLIKQP